MKRLIASLRKEHAEGRLADQLGFYAKPKLLIIEELGYLPLERARVLAGRHASLLARQRLADDEPAGHRMGPRIRRRDDRSGRTRRLLHHSYPLLVNGEGYRRKQQRKAGLLGSAGPEDLITERNGGSIVVV